MMKVYMSAAALVIAGVLGGTYLWLTASRSDDQFAACRASAIAGGAGAIGGPFTLVNGEGVEVTDADVITKPSLLYFGFTFCPDVCPMDNQRNAEAMDILQADDTPIQGVFISIDPERDTPEVVKEYTRWLHPDMVGLTGSPEQVKAASQAYKTYYRKQDAEDDEFYLVDHSTFTYLVLPDHGFVEFFRRDISPEQLAETTQCFIDAA